MFNQLIAVGFFGGGVFFFFFWFFFISGLPDST